MKINDDILNGIHGFGSDETYVTPPAEVVEKLEDFRDKKFGLMVHFGLYNQLGIIESWPLSDHDAPWSRKDIDYLESGKEFRKEYFNLIRSFNPVAFNPGEWADIAKNAGFKYFIFTTKHHDGFCMYDSKFSDYKVTNPLCPYSENKYANIAKCLFDEFRKRDITINAYFSKPDWHSEYYWTPNMEHSENTWRFPSYDIDEYPEIWDKFVEFTQNQMEEIVEDMGPVDALWLDGGQVTRKAGLNIHLTEFAEKMRKKFPSLIFVDRTASDENENYITPELKIPEKEIKAPWESNITLGSAFSYRFDDEYKSAKEVIHLLCDIVCKGGNLALNISPRPDGKFPAPAVRELEKIGSWLNKFGDAIYGTRTYSVNKSGNIAFTKKENSVYAIILNKDDAKEVFIPFNEDFKDVKSLGSDITWEKEKGGVKVRFKNTDEIADAVEFLL